MVKTLFVRNLKTIYKPWIIFSLGIRIRMHFCINIDLSPKNTLKLGDKR